LDRIRSNKSILIGFFSILLITISAHFLLKDSTFISGILWGVTLSYIGLILFIFIPNFKNNDSQKTFSALQYILRSIIRMGTIIIIFSALVFLLKVHALGLLAGAFAGMMVLSFLFLYKMKSAQ